MVLWMILMVLSVWAVIGTARAVRADGLRRIRTAPIVRPVEPR